MQRKAECRGSPLSCLDQFIFCTAVCGNAGFCKEQAKEHTMYVTARATPARRGIAHNAKQKTFFCFASPLCSYWLMPISQFSLCCRLPSLRSGTSSGFALLVDSDNWLHTFFSREKKVCKEKRNVAALRCRALINLFFAQQYAAMPGFARSKQRSILCM